MESIGIVLHKLKKSVVSTCFMELRVNNVLLKNFIGTQVISSDRFNDRSIEYLCGIFMVTSSQVHIFQGIFRYYVCVVLSIVTSSWVYVFWERVYMRPEVNSNWFEIFRDKISLCCKVTSLSAFTWLRAKWKSLRCKCHFQIAVSFPCNQ